MFEYQECVNSVKNLAKQARSYYPSLNWKHNQWLNHYAKAFGYQGYNHFCSTLEGFPKDQLQNVSLKLLRMYCEKIEPSLDCPYYEYYSFYGSENIETGFYSQYIGWDKNGEEVRVPRPLIGLGSVKNQRKLGKKPIYVIEDEKHLIAWLFVWKGTAYIAEGLAKDFFKSNFDKEKLVCNDVDMDVVQLRYRERMSHIFG